MEDTDGASTNDEAGASCARVGCACAGRRLASREQLERVPRPWREMAPVHLREFQAEFHALRGGPASRRNGQGCTGWILDWLIPGI
mmetsp:Transcript_5983/g.9879  ORF Transcript_5983/g.9879 Transcript_5983/m.9879 type:complete len:86 (+) Transcript_5983:137-394(+)|eukprot:CAMPEP_0206160564 /NCGR_PEP_ID=MMETSP1474-20131121/6889_1 /ASSEMBLY_ACC=CAM_ASM_001110 /TAXON_ID=97495 /ORGANISM="Imantonia sp., Strain RCC918" /LENGTH=85 /DNA_ID=CAMNT_0053561991 /DNA_START=104 /DNA_END=361 /DNA_ORIENTATION=+